MVLKLEGREFLSAGIIGRGVWEFVVYAPILSDRFSTRLGSIWLCVDMAFGIGCGGACPGTVRGVESVKEGGDMGNLVSSGEDCNGDASSETIEPAVGLMVHLFGL